jgi:PHD/YefM family antitoxin component YafN of YafNO toxin-antitoxin module
LYEKHVSYKTEAIMAMRQSPIKSQPRARRRPRTSRSHESVTVTEAASKVRQHFAVSLNRVAFKRDRILLERHGKLVAAMVPVEDLELLEELEDRLDLAVARAALVESKVKGTRPWEKIKAVLGR